MAKLTRRELQKLMAVQSVQPITNENGENEMKHQETELTYQDKSNKKLSPAVLPSTYDFQVKREKRRDGNIWKYVFFDDGLSKCLKESEHFRTFLATQIQDLRWHRVYSQQAKVKAQKELLESTGKVDPGIVRSVYYIPWNLDLAQLVEDAILEYKVRFNQIDDDETENESKNEDYGIDNLLDDDSNDDSEQDHDLALPQWLENSHRTTLDKIKVLFAQSSKGKDAIFVSAMLDRIAENENKRKVASTGEIKSRASVIKFVNDNMPEDEEYEDEEYEDEEYEDEEIELDWECIVSPGKKSSAALLDFAQQAKAQGGILSVEKDTLLRNISTIKLPSKVVTALRLIPRSDGNEKGEETTAKAKQSTAPSNSPTQNDVMLQVAKQLADLSALVSQSVQQ